MEYKIRKKMQSNLNVNYDLNGERYKPKGKSLNFGCGNDIMEGFDNVDIQKGKGIKKSFNFEEFPYPIKDNTYDYILFLNVLEHMINASGVMYELHRICKSKAVIKIVVPYYNDKGAFGDLEHYHYFSEGTFEYFCNKFCRISNKRYFKIKKLILVPTKFGKWIPSNFLRKKLSLFLGGIIAQIHVDLEVIK